MSSILDNFKIFRYFPQELKQNIKLFHIFEENIAYCVTNDDKVYGFGDKICQYLGYTQRNNNKNYVLIQELCDKRIEHFFGYFWTFFAISEINEIYSWGWNEHGQLAREYSSDEYLKPEMVQFFTNKNIISISCGFLHCLALSSDGIVFGWGDNCEKQIDQNLMETVVLIPRVLRKLSEKIKTIKCTQYSSLALTFSGKVFCYSDDKYMNWEIPGKVIIDLFVKSDYMFCQTNDCFYEIRDKKLTKTDYRNPFEYYFNRFQETYKSIHLKNSEMFSIDFQLSEDSKEMKKILKTIDLNESKSMISYSVFSDLSKTIKSEIKCFYKSKSFEFLVMNDNKVFVIGIDFDGKLGLGHIDECHVFTEIKELSHKMIEDFFEGEDCMFARSKTNEIYSWGENDYGQLGRGFKSSDVVEPGIIKFFTDKKIVQINCSSSHCLALSSDGKVYGWGHNDEGEAGSKKNTFNTNFNSIITENINTIPELIDFVNPIKLINCCDNSSFAVDFEGNAYYWGKQYENWKNISSKQYIPKALKIQNYDKILFTTKITLILTKSSRNGYIIILDNNGNVFLSKDMKDYNQIPLKKKIIDLIEEDESVFLESQTNVWEIDCINLELKSIDYNNYLRSTKIYHKTYHLKREGYFVTKKIQWNSQKKKLEIREKNVFEGKYHTQFDEIKLIGEGGFGGVFEVKSKINQYLYAIKEIEIKTSDLTKRHSIISEFRILSKLKSDFIVQYFDSWIEEFVDNKQTIERIYLQMELCQTNLKFITNEILANITISFKSFNFFISCELFRELAKALNYLHLNNIIHKNLTPENVLISDGINGVFLKLSDFGFEIIHELSQQRQMVGTDSYYMAPEVRFGQNHSLKSDIYSLAIIGTEIFNFGEKVSNKHQKDLFKYLLPYLGTNIELNFRKLLDLLSICLHSEDSRPDSNQIVDKINELSVDFRDLVINDINILKEIEILFEKQNSNFLRRFFYKKINN